MKIDRFFDIQCSKCGRWRSTDFQKGMSMSLEGIKRLSQKEGWTYKNRKGNLCPVCSYNMNLEEFIREYT